MMIRRRKTNNGGGETVDGQKKPLARLAAHGFVARRVVPDVVPTGAQLPLLLRGGDDYDQGSLEFIPQGRRAPHVVRREQVAHRPAVLLRRD